MPLDIQHLNQWKLGTPIALGDGILFLTYATLRSHRGDRGTRLRQLIEARQAESVEILRGWMDEREEKA